MARLGRLPSGKLRGQVPPRRPRTGAPDGSPRAPRRADRTRNGVRRDREHSNRIATGLTPASPPAGCDADRTQNRGVDVVMCAPRDCADRLTELGLPLVRVGQAVRTLVRGPTIPARARVPEIAAALIAAQFELLGTVAEASDAIVSVFVRFGSVRAPENAARVAIEAVRAHGRRILLGVAAPDAISGARRSQVAAALRGRGALRAVTGWLVCQPRRGRRPANSPCDGWLGPGRRARAAAASRDWRAASRRRVPRPSGRSSRGCGRR